MLRTLYEACYLEETIAAVGRESDDETQSFLVGYIRYLSDDEERYCRSTKDDVDAPYLRKYRTRYVRLAGPIS